MILISKARLFRRSFDVSSLISAFISKTHKGKKGEPIEKKEVLHALASTIRNSKDWGGKQRNAPKNKKKSN